MGERWKKPSGICLLLEKIKIKKNKNLNLLLHRRQIHPPGTQVLPEKLECSISFSHEEKKYESEVVRDLKSSGPNPFLKSDHPAGCPGLVCCVQTAFKYLQGWRFYKLSGQPVPQLSHLYSKPNQTKPKCFLLFR